MPFSVVVDSLGLDAIVDQHNAVVERLVNGANYHFLVSSVGNYRRFVLVSEYLDNLSRQNQIGVNGTVSEEVLDIRFRKWRERQ